MDYEIIWSPDALDDIDDIAEFHEKQDAFYAQAVVEELIAKSRKLDRFPFRGRHVPELKSQDYCEVFAYSYRLIYEVVGQKVHIVATIPGKIPLNIERFDT